MLGSGTHSLDEVRDLDVVGQWNEERGETRGSVQWGAGLLGVPSLHLEQTPVGGAALFSWRD